MDELRVVTETQKHIESAIAGDLWKRQWDLGQKRDSYVELLQLAFQMDGQFAQWLANVGGTSEVEISEEVLRLVIPMRKAQAKIFLFASVDAQSALKDLVNAFRPPTEPTGYTERLRNSVRDFRLALDALLKAARVDLGVSDAPSSQMSTYRDTIPSAGEPK